MVEWHDAVISGPVARAHQGAAPEPARVDLFCFTYRKTPDQPSVVFWGVDTGAVPLADSFTAFVALVHD